MVIYAVCLGMTLAVEAKSEEEAIEKARTELQHELDNGIAGRARGAWDFDMYDVSKVDVRDDVMIFN
jgi:hypothetical protein